MDAEEVVGEVDDDFEMPSEEELKKMNVIATFKFDE